MFLLSPNLELRGIAERWERVPTFEEGIRRAEDGGYVFLNGKVSIVHYMQTRPRDRQSIFFSRKFQLPE